MRNWRQDFTFIRCARLVWPEVLDKALSVWGTKGKADAQREIKFLHRGFRAMVTLASMREDMGHLVGEISREAKVS